MPKQQFTEAEQHLLEQIMRQRRDVRGNNFIDKAVAQNTLDKILQAASFAPSVGYSQPWEFVIIRDKDIKTQIADCFAVENEIAANVFTNQKQQTYAKLKLEGILEAPINIAVFYKPSSEPVLGQNTMIETGEYSVVCAIQNMWLMSRALNIGMGWVSILNTASVMNILKAPATNKLVAYLCLGHVKEFLELPELETIQWKKRKSISSTIYSDTY